MSYIILDEYRSPEWTTEDKGVNCGCVYFTFDPTNPNYEYFTDDGKPHCIHVDESEQKRCKIVSRWLRSKGLTWNDWKDDLDIQKECKTILKLS